MFRRFCAYVEQERLFAGCGKLLVAVSGGVDSVVLLHLMKRYTREYGDLALGIAHCNFHLRGEESDRDERFVREVAETFDLPLFTVSFDTTAYAAQHRVSVEMAARDLRYGYFSRLIRQESFDACLLAHHADDNAETFFINLFRGSGVKGLRGMLPRSGSSDLYLRPLLFARRAEILDYAREYGLEYVEDSTNRQEIYLRNRIRHSVLPGIEESCPGFVGKLGQTMSTLRAVDRLVSDWYAETCVRLIRKPESSVLLGDWWRSRIPEGFTVGRQECLPDKELAALQVHKVLFLELYLRERSFSRQQIGQVLQNEAVGIAGKFFVNTDGSGIFLHESDGWRWISFVRKPGGGNPTEDGLETFSPETALVDAASVPACRQESQEVSSLGEVDPNRMKVYLSYEKLQFPLYWRHWQAGDRFKPLGMKGFKKLSDFFTDQHLSLAEKDSVWLLCSGRDIVWVAGYRMDDRYKLDFSRSGPKKAWVVSLVYGEDRES